MSLKEVVIMRGLPGSGKSTTVRERYATAVVVSADLFFTSQLDGSYNFDPKRIGEAHAWCLARFIEALKAEKPLIVVDNTNSQRWEFANYETLARDRGYNIREHSVGVVERYLPEFLRLCATRNIHGVPRHKIEEMARRWEQ